MLFQIAFIQKNELFYCYQQFLKKNYYLSGFELERKFIFELLNSKGSQLKPMAPIFSEAEHFTYESGFVKLLCF